MRLGVDALLERAPAGLTTDGMSTIIEIARKALRTFVKSTIVLRSVVVRLLVSILNGMALSVNITIGGLSPKSEICRLESYTLGRTRSRKLWLLQLWTFSYFLDFFGLQAMMAHIS